MIIIFSILIDVIVKIIHANWEIYLTWNTRITFLTKIVLYSVCSLHKWELYTVNSILKKRSTWITITRHSTTSIFAKITWIIVCVDHEWHNFIAKIDKQLQSLQKLHELQLWHKFWYFWAQSQQSSISCYQTLFQI